VQALMASRGWVDPQIKTIAEDSFTLAQRSGPANPHKVPMLWHIFTYHHTASHQHEARAVVDEIAATADRLGDAGLRAAALTGLGSVLLTEGKCAETADCLRRAIAIYESDVSRRKDPRFGMDTLVLARGILAPIAWFDGNDGLARELVEGALAWARELGHIPSLGMALLYSAQHGQYAGDKARTAAATGELLMLAQKHGLPAFEGYAALLHAWATGSQDGVDFILGLLKQLGCSLGLAYYASLRAESLADKDDVDAALRHVDECLMLCETIEEHYYEPMLYWRQANYRIRSGAPAESIAASLEMAVRRAREYANPRVEKLALAAILQRADGGNPN
jgi:hypothetical protein